MENVCIRKNDYIACQDKNIKLSLQILLKPDIAKLKKKIITFCIY